MRVVLLLCALVPSVGLNLRTASAKDLEELFAKASLENPHIWQLNVDVPSSGISNTTVQFLRSFRVCAGCRTWERIGAQYDGGYETCMDDIKQKDSIRAAFSMGVREEDEWSVHVNKKWNTPVYQFDCTVDAAQKCPGCHFFKKCIKSEDGSGDEFPGKSWTLKQVLQHTNLTDVPDRSLLMKMDIESAEWWVFEKEDESVLRKFREMSVEFHVLRVANEHERKLRAMRKLQQAGFLVAHIHGNNYAPFIKLGSYNFPDVVEVNLVSNRDGRLKTCDNQPMDLPSDAPNNPVGAFFPPAELPKL